MPRTLAWRDAVPQRGWRPVASLVVAALAAWLAFVLTPAASVELGPVRAQLAARPGTGSAVHMVHGGHVHDDLVQGPLSVHVTVAMAARPASEPRLLASLADARTHLLRAVLRYLLEVIVVAALVATLLGVAVFRRAKGRVLGTALLAVLGVLGSSAATAATTRTDAFDAASCAHGWSKYVVADLPDLTPKAPGVGAPPVPAPVGTTPLLLIADDHLNPEGLRFAAAVAHQAHVAAVLDAGDTSSYGLSGEACVVTPMLRRFGVPYLWTRGNHDGAQFAAAMRAVRGVQVLDGSTADVAGVTVYGLGDPAFTPHLRDDPAALAASVASVRPRIRADLAALRTPADIALVHDCRMALADGARTAPGLPALLLCGHTHQLAVAHAGTTLVLHTGTVGGGGLTAFDTGLPSPFTAVVLYLSTTTHQLVRYDVVSGLGGQQQAAWDTQPLLPEPPTGPATLALPGQPGSLPR